MGMLRGLSFSVSICFQIRSESRSPKTDCMSISQSIGGMVSLTKLKTCEDNYRAVDKTVRQPEIDESDSWFDQYCIVKGV